MTKTLAPSQSVTVRDPKGLKFISIVEDAYNKAGLSEEEAQRVNDTPGLADLIHGFIAENCLTDKFKDEEVKSKYTYPPEYKGPKSIAEQVATLRQLFPELKDVTFDESIASRPLPPNAEGWFAIPKWQTLAPTYGEAVEKVLAMIGSERIFYNYREGQTGPEYLRQHAKTAKMFRKLGDEQKGHDILIVPCQFGLRHRGRSVRRAREVMNANEFGLGAFVIGIMLLTHPEREVQWEQLHVDCAGDEFASGAVGGFSCAPFLCFRGGGLRFVTDGVDLPNEFCGSASAFLPQ